MVAPENSSFMVLFVQGAWHSEAHAAPLIASIKAAGYHCETTPYPSNILTAANPYTEPDHPDYSTPRQQDNILPDAHTDAAAIRKKLNTLIEDEGKTVLMFAHSYGGRAASEAADQTLSRAERMRNGKKGGLLGIFYACSVPLPVGMSMITFSEGTTFPGFMAHVSFLHRNFKDPCAISGGIDSVPGDCVIGQNCLHDRMAFRRDHTTRSGNLVVPRATTGPAAALEVLACTAIKPFERDEA